MGNDESGSPSIEIPGSFADGYSAALARMIGVVAADLGFDNPLLDRMVTAAGSDLLARAREVLGKRPRERLGADLPRSHADP